VGLSIISVGYDSISILLHIFAFSTWSSRGCA
jgi:hypothetical protein